MLEKRDGQKFKMKSTKQDFEITLEFTCMDRAALIIKGKG